MPHTELIEKNRTSMAAPKKPKSSSKKSKPTTVLHDVAKPGETPADSTSRPVIVGHKSTMKQDPMFKEPGDESEATRPARGKDLAPLSEDSLLAEESIESQPKGEKKPATSEPEPEAVGEFTLPVGLDEESVPEAVSEEKEDKSTKEPEPEPEFESEKTEPHKEEVEPAVENKPRKPKDEPKPEEVSKEKDEKSAEEASDNEVDETKATAEAKEQAEEDARKAEIQKLVNSKEFFVPIGQVSRRRSNYTVVILLILVIIAAAISINFAVDAEIIEIGIEPLTNFL